MQREYEVMGRLLQIHLGDITKLEVDAIVSSENSDLIMDAVDGPSVSAAIRRVEGEGIAAELARLGPIEPGRVVMTPAKQLPCRWVLHAASVVRTEEGHHSSEAMIRDAVRSALMMASALGLKSLAFPAFAVRATETPRARASQAMVQELVAGLRRQTSLRRVMVALLDPEAFLAFFEEAMKRATAANEPLVLRVDRDGAGLSYAFQEEGPVAHVASQPVAPGQEAELQEALRRLRRVDERRLLDPASELNALGARVHALFPPEVWERLSGEPRPLLLRLDEDLAGIPFELASADGRALAEHLQVGRRLVIRAGSTRRPAVAPSGGRLEALLLAGELEPLPGAAEELEFLLDLLWRRVAQRTRVSLLAGRRASRSAVLDLLPRLDLLHWCGHSEPRPTPEPAGGDEPVWTLRGEELLRPADLAHLRLKLRLVLANSCGTSDGTAMARAFLLAGARNYVGTLWDVDDAAARELALHLYEELFLGHTLGEALASARSRLRARDPLHWAAYVHYGDPRQRVFEAGA